MTKLNIESGARPTAVALRPQSASRDGIWKRGFISLLLGLALIAAPTAAFARDSADVVGREGGLGAAAALSSLIYGPAKLLYATGGLVVGAFAWAFTAGDTEVASKVFTRSLKGTYVITPNMLVGEEAVQFIGREEAETSAPIGTVASAQGTTVVTPGASYRAPYGTAGATVPSNGSGQSYQAQSSYSDQPTKYDDLGW